MGIVVGSDHGGYSMKQCVGAPRGDLPRFAHSSPECETRQHERPPARREDRGLALAHDLVRVFVDEQYTAEEQHMRPHAKFTALKQRYSKAPAGTEYHHEPIPI